MRQLGVMLLFLALNGCATASEPLRIDYDVDSNEMVYETKPMSVRTGASSALGLQGRALITIRALATCEGRDCAAPTVNLILRNAGDHETLLNYETLAFETDGRDHSWDKLLDRQEAVRVPPGDFLQIEISPQTFADLATARSVSGTIGGAPFRLDFEDRAQFRELMPYLQLAP